MDIEEFARQEAATKTSTVQQKKGYDDIVISESSRSTNKPNINSLMEQSDATVHGDPDQTITDFKAPSSLSKELDQSQATTTTNVTLNEFEHDQKKSTIDQKRSPSVQNKVTPKPQVLPSRYLVHQQTGNLQFIDIKFGILGNF
ncbi:unnamed protein product [Thelazia callipaeda]|uniref:Uncharacterized protein n=1 Tax=Thelazia callipaeda TaxID=103827 RepID=A0A0N5CKI8_THECL|nr:unnamed protein product [Thelazia callipaeda]